MQNETENSKPTFAEIQARAAQLSSEEPITLRAETLVWQTSPDTNASLANPNTILNYIGFANHDMTSHWTFVGTAQISFTLIPVTERNGAMLTKLHEAKAELTKRYLESINSIEHEIGKLTALEFKGEQTWEQ